MTATGHVKKAILVAGMCGNIKCTVFIYVERGLSIVPHTVIVGNNR